MAARKQKLSDSLRLQQLFRDMEDEETWIREKEPIAASTNRGNVLSVQRTHRITVKSSYGLLQMFGDMNKKMIDKVLCVFHRQRPDRCPEPAEEAPGPAGGDQRPRSSHQGRDPERRGHGGGRYSFKLKALLGTFFDTVNIFLKKRCPLTPTLSFPGHFAVEEVKVKLSDLHGRWDTLKAKASQRRQDLEDSLQAQQYFADANEAESWMREKEPIVGSPDYGKDEDSAEVCEGGDVVS